MQSQPIDDAEWPWKLLDLVNALNFASSYRKNVFFRSSTFRKKKKRYRTMTRATVEVEPCMIVVE